MPQTENDIFAYLSAYPTLAGNGPANPNAGLGQWDEVSQSASVPRSWAETPDGYDAFRRRCTAAYRGEDDQWIFPTVGGNSSPLHTLITYPLRSMLGLRARVRVRGSVA